MVRNEFRLGRAECGRPRLDKSAVWHSWTGTSSGERLWKLSQLRIESVCIIQKQNNLNNLTHISVLPGKRHLARRDCSATAATATSTRKHRVSGRTYLIRIWLENSAATLAAGPAATLNALSAVPMSVVNRLVRLQILLIASGSFAHEGRSARVGKDGLFETYFCIPLRNYSECQTFKNLQKEECLVKVECVDSCSCDPTKCRNRIVQASNRIELPGHSLLNDDDAKH